MSIRAALFLPLLIIASLPDPALAQGACALLAAQGGTPGVAGNTSETNLLFVNPLSGAVNGVIGSLGMPITGLARHPVTGEIFGVTAEGTDPRKLVRVNTATGAASVIAPLVASHQAPRIGDLAFKSDGTLFGWNEEGDDLVTINLTSGESTLVGNAGISTLGGSIAFSPDSTLYSTPTTLGATSLRTIDPTTGLTSVVATLTGTPLPVTEPMSALTFSPAGTLFGVNLRNNLPRDSFLITINTANGIVTTRGPITTPRIDAIEHVCLPAFDFDGDLKANMGIFRSTSAEWFVSGSSSSPVRFGMVGDIALPADYDGDGLADLAVYRPETGEWFILGTTSGFTTFKFGAGTGTGLGDTAVPADYDGDGKVDAAIYRASTGNWFILGSTSGFQAITWGSSAASGLGDKPVPADYDGDGKADVAVYRSSTGTWFILGTVVSAKSLEFGAASMSGLGDTPVPSDYDGDGKADLAVYRAATGEWFILRSRDGFRTLVFGSATTTGFGDTPVPTDYDGDGKSDVAVYRAASGTWFYQGTLVGFRTVSFGASTVSGLGDIPLNRPAVLR